jgi:pyridoxal phosphate enzyme (YggS family)
VNSKKLAAEIDKQAKKRGAIQNILIQVNTSGEETKSGCAPCELSEILSFSKDCKNVFVKGLMTIAPLYVNGVTATLHFDNTHKLYIDNKKNKYDNISMDILSMGMSADYKEAILSGANMIRVGSAIFGKRNY